MSYPSVILKHIAVRLGTFYEKYLFFTVSTEPTYGLDTTGEEIWVGTPSGLARYADGELEVVAEYRESTIEPVIRGIDVDEDE